MWADLNQTGALRSRTECRAACCALCTAGALHETGVSFSKHARNCAHSRMCTVSGSAISSSPREASRRRPQGALRCGVYRAFEGVLDFAAACGRARGRQRADQHDAAALNGPDPCKRCECAATADMCSGRNTSRLALATR